MGSGLFSRRTRRTASATAPAACWATSQEALTANRVLFDAAAPGGAIGRYGGQVFRLVNPLQVLWRGRLPAWPLGLVGQAAALQMAKGLLNPCGIFRVTAGFVLLEQGIVVEISHS